MKRHISIFTFLLGAFAAVGPARAAEGTFQYWALSTHPCTITDYDGEGLPFDRYNEANGGYYHVFKSDLGITDLVINESGGHDRITANEPTGLRFKGWWTKKDGWTGNEAYVGEIDTPMTGNRTITGAEIKTAGEWSARPTIVAKYVPIYTITTSVTPTDAGMATGDGTYEEDETVTLQASPATGYSFLHWTKSGAVVSSDRSYEFVALASGTYVAVFTGNVYKVVFDQQEGTGGSATAFVTYGEKASTPITPPDRFGWTFGGYYTERKGEGTKVYNADGTPADVWKTAGNLTLYAYWIPDPCDLTIRPPAFGVTEIQYRLGEDKNWVKVTGETTVEVLCGTVCHVYVKEQSGYDLGSPGLPWTSEDSIPGHWKAEMTGNGLVFAPQADWIGYRLTVEPNGGTYRQSTERYTWTERLRPGETNLNSIGTVTGGGAVFLGFFDGRGEPVYDANGENVEGTYWTKPCPDGVFRGTGDLTVYARWGQPKLAVSVGVNDPQMGSATGGGSFEAGETVHLEAVAKAGYFFLYWKKGEAEVSSANPYEFLASASTAGAYTAVFGKQTYTVSFFGNGGTNEMASQSFEYNVAKGLTSNKFERAGFDFAGWLTDPTNTTWTYKDGEIVSNLNARLFANWTLKDVPPFEPTNYTGNAYSVAADCATNRVVDAVGTVAEALELSIDKKTLCTVVSNVTDIGENEQCIKMIPVPGSEPASMSATVAGSGKFEFSYKNVVEGNSSLSIQTNGIEIGSIGETTDGWKKFLIDMKSEGPVKVSWSFTNIGKKYDYALIDDIRWIPDEQPTPPGPVGPTTVGVTLRLNDGTPVPDDIYTNLTCEVGHAIGALPDPGGAGGFKGWFTADNVAVTNEWSVPSESVQLYAKWQYAVVAIPTAVGGLVYDGNLKTGVVEGVGYTLTGNTATDAGDYSATATLLQGGYVWSDGKSEAKEIAWSIGKATYDLSGVSMTNATYVYDGEPHSLAISGELPDGVTVTYSTNDCIEVGEYEIKASFTGDEVNHLKIEKQLFATLTILSQDDPPPTPPTPQSLITNEVPVAVTGLVYDGTPKTGVPTGEGYGIVSNVATSAGTYVATAVPDEGHVWSDGFARPTNIVWSIAKGTPDVSGITFPSATYEYDGNEHSIGIVGTLPPGIKVEYSGDPTNRTEVGTNTVTASFVITDTANWNVVSLGSLEATLTIIKKLTPAEAGVLYFDEDLGTFSAAAAATYNGWLEDPATGDLLAVLQVKTAAAKAGKERKTTISVTPVGGKKKTYKSTIVGSGDHPADGYGIVYGALGLTGSTHGFVGVPDGARVQAAKDFTKAKDPAEKSRAARIPISTWTIAAETASGGYDCLSVAVAKTGKATVKGTLSDGTTVSVSGYGALGADAFVVPIVYSKDIKPKDTGVKTHVEFTGILWIAANRSAVLVSRSKRWIGAEVAELGIVGPNAWPVGFAVPGWRSYLAKADDGYDVTPTELPVDLTAAKKFSVPKTSGSVKVDKDTGKTYVKPSGANVPSNLSKFKLTLTAKTGQVKGSFKLYYLDGVKLKTDSVTVTGMMVGDRFYGNATVKKVGTAAIWFE